MTFASGRPAAVTAAVTAVTLVASGCTSSSAGTQPSRPALRGSIVVSAAASLTGPFDALATSFEKAHHGTTVLFNFGSSATLLTQIEQGAPADVFASAGSKEMSEAVAAGFVDGPPATFARNTLEIVVKPGNPLGIRSLADLTKARVISLCVSSAPCGAAARTALRHAGVTLPASRVTLGQDVKTTLQAVTAGDADAGVVYVTDASTAGAAVTAVAIPAAQNVVTDDVIGVVKGTRSPSLARSWVDYVDGPDGQRVLRQMGFLPPAS